MLSGGGMARQLRIEYEGAIYHITARGNERKKIFFTDRDYQKFKEYLIVAQERFDCVLHAYVLMGNHYHLILETKERNLSRIMHYLNSSYTTYINVKRKRNGHLLQGRFKSIIVDRDSYLLELSRYVHLNPVRAGVAQRPEEYPYSSYQAYIGRRPTDCVNTELVLGMAALTACVAPNKYREFVESSIGAEVSDPLEKVYGGLVLGSARFIRKTLDRLEENRLEDEEITQRRVLRTGTGQKAILEAVTEQLGRAGKDLQVDDGKAKKFAIYFLRHYLGMTSKEVSQALGGMSCAAVAKSYQRFRNQLASDGDLKREVDELKGCLSNVQV